MDQSTILRNSIREFWILPAISRKLAYMMVLSPMDLATRPSLLPKAMLHEFTRGIVNGRCDHSLIDCLSSEKRVRSAGILGVMVYCLFRHVS